METLFLCSRELVKKQGRGYDFTISENESTILLFLAKRENDFTRRVEFIFSQSAPAVCLPCRQTDDVCRLYHDFSGTCRGLSLKKCVKLALTAFWRTESEVSFSFDQFYPAAFFLQGGAGTVHRKNTELCDFFTNRVYFIL